MTGVVVLLVVLVLAAGFGLWRRRTDGRLRPVPARQPHGPAGPDRASDGAEPDVLGAADLGSPLGERATLVQFSTAFCAPCRGTRVVLGEVAGMLPGVRHVDIDAEAHLDLVRRLDVQRTPTVFVLDGAGQVRSRAAGAPRKADVIAALGEFLSDRCAVSARRFASRDTDRRPAGIWDGVAWASAPRDADEAT